MPIFNNDEENNKKKSKNPNFYDVSKRENKPDLPRGDLNYKLSGEKRERPQASMMSPEEQMRWPEGGSREEDPSDYMPESHGGSVDVAGVFGVGKKLGKATTAMQELVPGGSFFKRTEKFIDTSKDATQAGKKLMQEAEEVKGLGRLEKIKEAGPPPRSVDYGKMAEERKAARAASEAAAPTMDYAEEGMKKTKAEMAREAKLKKMKPASFRYEKGVPIEE